MYDMVHQRVAQRAGKKVTWAHEELKRVQSFVSTYNADNVKNDRNNAETKSTMMDPAGVERALVDA